MLMSEVKNISNGDIVLSRMRGLILHTCYKGINDVGVGNLLQLILAPSEAFYIVTYAFVSLMLAS